MKAWELNLLDDGKTQWFTHRDENNYVDFGVNADAVPLMFEALLSARDELRFLGQPGRIASSDVFMQVEDALRKAKDIGRTD